MLRKGKRSGLFPGDGAGIAGPRWVKPATPVTKAIGNGHVRWTTRYAGRLARVIDYREQEWIASQGRPHGRRWGTAYDSGNGLGVLFLGSAFRDMASISKREARVFFLSGCMSALDRQMGRRSVTTWMTSGVSLFWIALRIVILLYHSVASIFVFQLEDFACFDGFLLVSLPHEGWWMTALARERKLPGPRNWDQGSELQLAGRKRPAPSLPQSGGCPRRQSRSGHRLHEARSLCPTSQQPLSAGATGISFRSPLPLRATVHHTAFPFPSFRAYSTPTSGESPVGGTAERKHTLAWDYPFMMPRPCRPRLHKRE